MALRAAYSGSLREVVLAIAIAGVAAAADTRADSSSSKEPPIFFLQVKAADPYYFSGALQFSSESKV